MHFAVGFDLHTMINEKKLELSIWHETCQINWNRTNIKRDLLAICIITLI